MFAKLIKDDLDIALTNAHKQCLEYLKIVSTLRVEYQNSLEAMSKKYEAMQKEKNDEIKHLKSEIAKVSQKYV